MRSIVRRFICRPFVSMCSPFFIVPFSAAAALLLSTGAVRAADSADELVKKGAVEDARFQPAEALKFYLPAEKLEPANVSLQVRIARQYRHLMSDATKSEEKLKLGGIAVGYSRRAVALAPNDPEAQLSIAISYGKVLPLQGNGEQIENSRLLKAAAEKVVKLDPRNDLGWHVLGRWYMNMADVGAVKRALAQIVYGKLPPATNEDAVRCFEKAIALNPNRLMHSIELGRTYARMGRTEEARKWITKGLALAETERDDPETKKQGRAVLEKLR